MSSDRLRSLSGNQLEFKFVGGSKPPSFQTKRFSGAAINFTNADAAFGAALSGSGGFPQVLVSERTTTLCSSRIPPASDDDPTKGR